MSINPLGNDEKKLIIDIDAFESKKWKERGEISVQMW